MVETLKRKLKGWALRSHQFVDFKAKVFSYIDRGCSGSWLTGWPENIVKALPHLEAGGGVNHRNRAE